MKIVKLSAITNVVSDPDLISLILMGNVGPSSFATASLVSKAWRSVCMTDERIIRSVACYQGGLTKGTFTKLFALSSSDADVLPRTTHRRYAGGIYFLYHDAAVEAVLKRGGMDRWCERLRLQADRPRVGRCNQNYRSLHSIFQQEERLHLRTSQRRLCGLLKTVENFTTQN